MTFSHNDPAPDKEWYILALKKNSGTFIANIFPYSMTTQKLNSSVMTTLSPRMSSSLDRELATMTSGGNGVFGGAIDADANPVDVISGNGVLFTPFIFEGHLRPLI